LDLFFGQAQGLWEENYAAQHQGDGVWKGTGEKVLLEGKNKIADVFNGSADANILVLTDDANGDALFVDDIYTALGDQARFSQIDEIRAGAGDDIVDMTSERYAYEGDGITIYGGSGNDTIWANKGSNVLFGDAGNDRLVGGSGDDVIAGGSGNDAMHGGGGDDIFTFGSNWGNDTVEQLETGSVTLWFAEGDESGWNSETMTYSDGVNSVSVSGCVNVILKFGASADLPAGVFDSETSQKVFENKGMLA
jgi:Ca2+-binding RTX toxin-like protein